MVEDAEGLAAKIPHAGAIFLGPWTPEAIGDYIGGPNHVLPTGGAARSFSGLSVRDFLRWGRYEVVADAGAWHRVEDGAQSRSR